MPNKSPNLIQSLLRNKSKSAFNIVIMKKIAEIVPNIYARFEDLFTKKYPAIIINTRVRHLVHWSRDHDVREELLKYINRLSDLLFVLARVLESERGHQPTLWNKHLVLPQPD